eukprot:403339948
MDYNQKRLTSFSAQAKPKVKLPYKMMQGMQKKSLDRAHQQKDQDKKLGIIADTSRLGPKKMMQSYFEKKDVEQKHIQRQNLDKDRGINFHLYSAAKFRDGALNLTKEGIRQIESDEPITRITKHGNQSRKSYDEITKQRESNPEFMTGKRFRKKKGNVGKKFKSKKKGKRN